MRKLARVGRPARRSRIRARTSGSRSSSAGLGGGVDHRGQLAVDLRGLPLVAARDGGQLVDPVADGRQPVGDRVAAVEPVGHLAEPVEALGEPAGEVDAGAADVVERQRRTEEPVGVVADRHPGEDPVEAEAPGVLHVALQAERLAVVGVEGPPDAGLLHPVGDRLEVGVGEPEATAHRPGGQQVEHPARLGPAAGEVEQLAHDGEQRVGLGQRPVGQPDPQLVAGVPADVAHPERGRDQRRVGLDVGAHHQDVARLEGRVVGEQAEHHLAQHLDLAGRAVAGVHLDRVVVGAERAGRRVDGGVGGDVVLQPAEQGRLGRWSSLRSLGRSTVGPDHRQRGSAASSRRSRPSEASSGCADPLVRAVLAARHGTARGRSASPTARRRGAAARGGRRGAPPARRAARPRSPGCGCGRTARTAAAGRPRRVASRSAVEHLAVSLVRRGRPDPRDEQPPELGLPGQVRVERRHRRRRCRGPPPSRRAGSAAARRTTRTAAPAAGPRRSDVRAGARPPRRPRRGRGAG